MIERHLLSDGRLIEEPPSPFDESPIPPGSVLFLEQEHATITIRAGGEPGGMEQHQRQEGESGGRSTARMVGEQVAEPGGFLTNLESDDLVAPRRGVSFVEHQVKALVNRVEPRGEVFPVRNRELDPLIDQLLASALDPFLDRFLRDQQPVARSRRC